MKKKNYVSFYFIICFEHHLDHRVNISDVDRFLYLLSSRSAPIGDDRDGNNGRRLFAKINWIIIFLFSDCNRKKKKLTLQNNTNLNIELQF